MASDPDFATAEGRSRNYDRIYGLVADEMKKRGTQEWVEALEHADIPVQRMNSLDDIMADPHLAATGYFRTVEHPTEGRIMSMAVPSEWSESPPEYRRHAPGLGEHTREVLTESGYSEKKIQELLASGAARSAD
jgi:crotonobetainyl-CoA:carnitine CoA-transferase CaiB-like acyl-CoA transferase